MSPALVEEYLGVLLRPKFNSVGPPELRKQVVEAFLSLPNTTVVLPELLLDVLKEDPQDNRVLECAVAAGASFIVSGDRYLLAVAEFSGAPVLDPAGFLERLSCEKGPSLNSRKD